MSDPPNRPQEDFLVRRLSEPGKEALKKLCALGCDKQILGGLLVLLAPEQERLTLDSGKQICLRPLDALDDSLKGISDQLAEKKDIRALQRTAQRAKKLRDEIKQLRGTAFVAWLKEKGYIDDNDLLGGSTIPELVDCRFRGLLSLPNLADQVGPRQRPEYTNLLKQIYLHIHERTGGWHDQELTEILHDLMPQGPDTKRLDLPSWRQRHGLTDPK